MEEAAAGQVQKPGLEPGGWAQAAGQSWTYGRPLVGGLTLAWEDKTDTLTCDNDTGSLRASNVHSGQDRAPGIRLDGTGMGVVVGLGPGVSHLPPLNEILLEAGLASQALAGLNVEFLLVTVEEASCPMPGRGGGGGLPGLGHSPGNPQGGLQGLGQVSWRWGGGSVQALLANPQERHGDSIVVASASIPGRSTLACTPRSPHFTPCWSHLLLGCTVAP